MRALIVDPDRVSRGAMKRLLTHVNVECAEADNGLVGLNMLSEVDPDFVVLEVDMPILSGPDMLAAVRQSPDRSDVPAIAVSASGRREHVMRMVGLGVVDYLVKPINPVEVLPRIKALVQRAAQWRQRQSARTISGLLIVDADPNFLAFVKPLLETSFEVHQANSSTVAAMTYRDAPRRPTVICLAEGLPLMSEDLLVDVIRRMALDEGASPPQFFLLARTEDVPREKSARYAGVVRKSFVPQQFVDEFRRVVLREQSAIERLRRLVRESLHAELVSAAEQTVGVMIGSEIAEVTGADAEGCPDEILASLALADEVQGVRLLVEVTSGRSEVERMGSQIVRRTITFEEGANEVLGELVNTVAGRMRASLVSRGLDLKMGLPEVRARAEGEAGAEADDSCVVRCGTGDRLRVSMRVENIGLGLGLTTQEAAGGPVAEGAASVDDVLF